MEEKEKNVFSFKINILESLMLNLYTEKDIYNITYNSFQNKMEDTLKKYKRAIDIQILFEKVKIKESLEDKIKLCKEFLQQEDGNGFVYNDIIDIDFNSLKGDSIRYGISISDIDPDTCNTDLARHELYRIKSGINRVSENIIANFVQLFEEFFKSYLKVLVKEKPEAYFFNKTIEYKKLVSKQNFEELKKDLINETVEELMFDVNSTLNKISNIHGYKLEKYSNIIEKFTELCLRRNIIVHNQCIVNEKYLNGLPKSFEKKLLNEKLICDEKYINDSLNTIFQLAVLLIYLSGESEDVIEMIEKTGFHLLKNSKWENAMFSYELLSKIKIIDNEQKLNFKINYLNAKKHILGLDKVKKEIEEFDVSALENIYKIAKLLLLDNYDTINQELEKVYPNPFDFYTIEKWPIFIDYRKTNFYDEFKNNHAEDYALMYKVNEKESKDITNE